MRGTIMDELFIEFFRGKEEQAFLDAWFDKHGKLSEVEIDELYKNIANAVDEDIKNNAHELGKEYVYQGVTVGKSDYNEFYNLYLFEQ